MAEAGPGSSFPSAEDRATARRTTVARFLRFGLVGFSGVVVNLSILAMLVEGVGWPVIWASLVAIELSTVSNYLLNRAWTWADRDRSWWSLMGYHAVTAVAMATQWAVVAGTTTFLGIHYLLAALAGIAAATAWNFLANHRITFTTYSPERRRRQLRLFLYGASFALQIVLASLLAHDWDTFVFQRSVEEFVRTGTTPYETGALKPAYAYVGDGIPIQALWYAYPPLPLLMMTLTYGPAALGLEPQLWVGRLLIHLPLVAANLALAFLASRFVGTASTSGLAARLGAVRVERFLLFNPLFILVATIWGQFEALVLVFMLLCFLALRAGRWTGAGAAWGLAALVKIFPLYVVPVLAVYVARRAGPRALARVAAGGAGVFALVSLPFFLLEPRGFVEQVFLLHTNRPPARFAPIAFLYQSLRWTDLRWPGHLPAQDVLIQGLSLLSVILTVAMLALLALGFARRANSEANLVLWTGLSLLGGLLATKVVNEQYALLPLGLLAIYRFHPEAARSGWAAARVRDVLLTLTLFMALAGMVDNAHFLVFLPEDVARALFGASVPALIGSLAGALGHSPAELIGALSVVVGAFLLVPFIATLRLLGPALWEGLAAFGHTIDPLIRRVGSSSRAIAVPAMALGLVALLMPPVAVGVLAPRSEPLDQDTGILPGFPIVLAHYRVDWFNPSHRPELAGGTWDRSMLTPAEGYYNTDARKILEDLETLQDLGVDGVVARLSPDFESRVRTVARGAEVTGLPFAVEFDLADLSDAQGQVAVVPETARSARQLLDGPTADFWSRGPHLRIGPEGGLLIFLEGVERVQPTFSEAEHRYVADLLVRSDEPSVDDVLAELGAEEFWTTGPTGVPDLLENSSAGALWRTGYVRAQELWWTEALGFASNVTRIELFVDAPFVVPEALSRFVEVRGDYTPLSAPTGPLSPDQAVATVFLAPLFPEQSEEEWVRAVASDPEVILVPWNDFDHGYAMEPTVEGGDALLLRAEAWLRGFRAFGPEAADIVPVFLAPSEGTGSS